MRMSPNFASNIKRISEKKSTSLPPEIIGEIKLINSLKFTYN